MSVSIQYPSVELIPSFYEALGTVARERVYIEMIEPPPLAKVTEFQLALMAKKGPIYYAVDGGKVIGWCDVFPEDNPRQSHRGSLGMGLLAAYRGQGLGLKLVTAVCEHAKRFGLEKIDLMVYTSNVPAISLYKRCRFEQEGLIRQYRKLDGVVYDALWMGKLL